LNLHDVSNVRQTERHTSEPLVPESSSVEVEVVIEELQGYKSPIIDQVPAELIQGGGNTLRYEIHRLVNSIWNKEEPPHQWKESIVIHIYKRIDKTDCSNCKRMYFLQTTY
jgi:hypothetical protein